MSPATGRGATSQSYHIVNTKSCHIFLNQYRIFDYVIEKFKHLTDLIIKLADCPQ